MDEASECDELLLMREGALLQHSTPEQLRERTGEHDLGRAFLTIIEQAVQVSARIDTRHGQARALADSS